MCKQRKNSRRAETDRLLEQWRCPSQPRRSAGSDHNYHTGLSIGQEEQEQMAVIAPFQAIFYNEETVGDLASVLSPPYDVLGAEEAEQMKTASPYSMVNLDLPAAEVGEGRYQMAAATYRQWLAEGVLLRDRTSRLYYQQTEYRLADGRVAIRKGLVCRVGLAEPGEGIVRAHEKTFDAVVADRLRLLTACNCQFSPIFALFSDPASRIVDALEGDGGQPMLCVTDRAGGRHQIVAVRSPAVIEEVKSFFADRPLYIADGHHRYATALAHRQREVACRGKLAVSDPANFAMMYLSPMEDSGLTILATHRLVRFAGGLTLERLLEQMGPSFDIQEMNHGTGPEQVEAVTAAMKRLARQGQVLGLFHPGSGRWFFLTPRRGDAGVEAVPQSIVSGLDVCVLSDLIARIASTLPGKTETARAAVEYFSDPQKAAATATTLVGSGGEGTPVLFLLNPTTVDQVRAVADQGECMPHKSTFFHPKVVTGLLLNPLTDIQGGDHG